MNEEVFNMSIRKFLKNTGVNSQREIEKSIKVALNSGKINLENTIDVEMILKIPKTNLEAKFNGKLNLK